MNEAATYLQTRSLRMGLRLYAMAELPIWFASKGSSTSFKFASSRRSVPILCAVAPREARAARTSASTLREYVLMMRSVDRVDSPGSCTYWLATGYAYSKPASSVTRRSRALTYGCVIIEGRLR